MKNLIKFLAAKLGLEVGRISPFDRTVVSLKHAGQSSGNVLLSFVLEPFLLEKNDSILNSHTSYWESLQIAQTFLDMGYSVDVISYMNNKFVPRKHYSFFISSRKNFDRIAKLLNNDCVKIAHIDKAHWITSNHNAYRRYLALKERRGVSFSVSCDMQEIDAAIDNADYATLLGNKYTLKTYAYAGKPMYALPIPAGTVYPWPEGKDFETCRRNFMWMGSRGPVHEGLDLALEAFAEMPEYHLYVCGPIYEETEFERAYFKELYQTPNIHSMGRIDTSSPNFLEITRNCVGLTYPSASEDCSGSVVTCMQAGIIPVISNESGIDIHDFGVILKDCSLNEIKESIRKVSDLPASELEDRTRRAWEFARATYTRENYVVEYQKAIRQIMEDRRSKVVLTRLGRNGSYQFRTAI